jgi:hypothetical protein
MNMRLLLFSIFILLLHEGIAQERRSFLESSLYSFDLGVGNRQVTSAFSWSHLHGLGKKDRFKVGYGLRYTNYFGKNKAFVTAPARLTSRQTGPQVLFSKTYDESLDTVRFMKAQVHMINLAIHLEYSILTTLDFGFNIDAVGFSFGPRQEGKLQSTLKPTDLSESQSAKPTSFNLLLVSDNDLGSLNSELYVRLWITKTIAIKTAFGFVFTEYTTDKKLIFDNDRFRNKASLAVVGITYNPFRKP